MKRDSCGMVLYSNIFLRVSPWPIHCGPGWKKNHVPVSIVHMYWQIACPLSDSENVFLHQIVRFLYCNKRSKNLQGEPRHVFEFPFFSFTLNNDSAMIALRTMPSSKKAPFLIVLFRSRIDIKLASKRPPWDFNSSPGRSITSTSLLS